MEFHSAKKKAAKSAKSKGGDVKLFVPDVYLRDNPMDTGDETTSHPIGISPDIIARQQIVSNPVAAFGQGSGVEDSTTLGQDILFNHNNYIYTRVKNKGTTAANNVTVTVYWSEPASLVHPAMWNKIGETQLNTVPGGDQIIVANPIMWSSVPAAGHYCFVGILSSDLEPSPPLNDLMNFNNFMDFVNKDNNVAWINFHIVPNVPSPQPPSEHIKGFVPLDFLITGAPDVMHPMDIEIITNLPPNGKIVLQGSTYLARLLNIPEDRIELLEGENEVLIYFATLNAVFSKVPLPAKSKYYCKLWVKIEDSNSRSYQYTVAVRQLYEGSEIGRITWVIQNEKPTYVSTEDKK
jgi:serine protease